MLRAVVVGLLCASCNQIFGLNETFVEPTDAAKQPRDGFVPDAPTRFPAGAPCASPTSCLSSVCLPSDSDPDTNSGSGSCADPNDIAYVAGLPNGTANGSCSITDPCATISEALATPQPIISVSGTVADIVTVGREVEIFGDGNNATLLASQPGPTVLTLSSPEVVVQDLTITGGGSAGGGQGGSGVVVTTGTLTMTHCSITANFGTGLIDDGGQNVTVTRSTIANNTGGGLHIQTGLYVVTNDFIVQNDSSGDTGGMSVDQNVSGRFEYNTVADNRNDSTDPSTGAALTCLSEVDVDNSIIVNNTPRQAGQDNLETGCTNGDGQGHSVSFVGSAADEPSLNFGGSAGYDLTSASAPALGQATASAVRVDIDGDSRPQDGFFDLGADELVRP